ncbi:MAG TPA: Calx-beta domain-containing protein [Pyrinomonadaceae bacterium]
MRYLRKWQLAFVCLLALALLPFAPAPRGTAQAPGYTVTDLGTLGGEASRAYGLDECGRVVGESQAAAGASAQFRPFRWKDGVMTDLGTLGGQSGTAYALNQGETVIGSALTAGSLPHPFVRPAAGPMQDIGTLGGFSAEAQDVNASGLVVGQSEDGGLQDRAFVWQSGVGMQALTAPWGTPIRAFGINDAGQIAGSANLSTSGTHAFVTVGGVAIDLGTLGGAVSVATEVSETGEVSGYSYITVPQGSITQSFHAFRWKDANANNQSDSGEMLDLGVLAGDKNSYAYDINNDGTVVGYSETGAPGNGNVTRAFIWTSANGLQDLNVVVPGTNWTFREARGINNRGQIVGYGVNPDGKAHAFLLTPTNVGPSPCDPTPTPTPTPGTLQFSAPTYTVGEGGGSVLISVSRAGGDDGAVSINYATTTGGTATAGSDYVATSGTLNFADGETTKTFGVTINDDTTDELDETVNLTLSTPGGGATLGSQTTAVLNITDNDATPTLSITKSVTVIEGNASSTTATFVVKLTGTSSRTVTVSYTTEWREWFTGTATPGEDYTTTSGTITYAPGESGERNVNVPVLGDTVDEPNETFVLQLFGPTNATYVTIPDDTFGIGTITDDDGAPSLSVGDATVTEGNSGTTAATFTVSLLPASGQTVTVNYATANGTATAGSDYASASGTVTFAPGETTKPVTVNVNGDTTPEAHEDFFVTLSSPSNATITDNQGKGIINNDDAALTIGDRGAAEGTGVTTNFNFAVGIQFPTVNTVTVNYATADGTGTAGSDYTAVASATLTFNPGETSKNAVVSVVGDNIYENDETFNVNLSSPTNATISDSQALGTITNDEEASLFVITNGPNLFWGEGDGTFTFRVSRSGSAPGGAQVSYSTSDGTATAGSDYTATSGTLTFAAGEAFKDVTVTIINDTLDEPDDETVNLTLTPGFGASPNPASATLHIGDNDAPPIFKLDSAVYTVAEGGAVTVTVTRTGGTNAATVNYNTANGTATAGSDYAGVEFGTLSFAQGDMSKTFQIATTNDVFDETDETFNVNLFVNTGSAAGTPSSATVTITDNDATPTLSFGDASSNGDVTVAEGQGTASFKVTLSAASGQIVTVNYATANGTATAGSDYAAVSGTLTFNPGETEKFFGVPITNDTIDEPNETFLANLSGASGATIATVNDGQAVGTITDDDGEPSLTVSAAVVDEGNSGTVNATFAIRLSEASDKTVTVVYATSDGTAKAPGDYVAVPPTMLTFAPGETVKMVNVAVVGDTLDEAIFENFNVNISNPTNASISNPTGQGTIIDDDDAAAPSISIGDAIVVEGNSGTTAATFTVTLSAVSGQEVTVNYSTADGTAAAPIDYASVGFATLSFAAGETTKTITVNVNGDTANEADETFFVQLHSPAHATLADSQGQGTITNDDGTSLRFSQAAYAVNESAHFVTVTVTRAGDPSSAVGVSFATSDGTATERRDYTAVSGRLQFASGETSKSFDVLLTEDAYTESVETINLTLSNPTGGASLGGQATATVNIAADDNPPPGVNPIDVSSDFVRQHYHDFLNREPDDAGLNFWIGEIEQCGADAGCREVKRINVSAAFFLSIEFQNSGYLVYRTYKAAYGDATSPNVEGTVPVVRLQEFLPDTRSIGEGVVVGQPEWDLKLEANKNAYMAEFVQRQRFLDAFPQSMPSAQFVDKLNLNAGGVLTQSERDGLVNDLAANAKTRAQVLRAVSENSVLQQNEFRRAFVLMQFYGYLRRNPNDPQDVDFRGWKFWLDKLNEFNGDYVRAEMVKAFLDSIEYRTRFAP